ncbi:hypothetical protein PISMIDRAFT_100930 [Pisolithus microcarpus 441]|uniref:Uncharacterized protein n=1 Tax=Pisolithus microcarpus 441 TaxID=765257 RepID=A0A0C9ZLA8_9AGAM|nr:hypothetical protein PISMIDRAFT_100930 [Pisolithus microcarpus 441]
MKGGVPFPLPVVQLLHDVATCWDSTYYMINRLRALDQVCNHHYSVLSSKALLRAIDLWMHWEVLQDLEFALQAPAMAHHTMTSERIPLLSGALPAYETFLEQWKRISMSSTNPQFGPLLKEGLAHRE